MLRIIMALAVGGILGMLMLRDDSVLLVVGPHRLQLNLWLFVIGLLVAALMGWLLLRLLVRMVAALRRFGDWYRGRQDRRAARAMQAGLAELTRGNDQRSARHLQASAGHAAEPLAHYLALARLARQSGDYRAGAEQMADGRQRLPELDDVLGLEQARLLIADGQLAAARDLLQTLPVSPTATGLLEEIHSELGDIDALEALLPRLRRDAGYVGDALLAIERRVYLHRLEAVAAVRELDQLQRRKPRALKRDDEVAAGEACARLRLLDHAGAERALRKLLPRLLTRPAESPHEPPHEPLLLLSCWVDAARQVPLDTRQQHRQLGKWLGQAPDSWALPLVIARLHLQAGDADAAQTHAEASLQQRRTVDGLRTLADIMDRNGQPQRSAALLREALDLSTGETAAPRIEYRRED